MNADCIGGKGICPPEDCGKTSGYEECCETTQMSPRQIIKLDAYAREEVETRLEWLDGWQPEAFDLEALLEEFDV